MPSSYIFYPPPMPARLVPPRIYAPIPDIIVGGDNPPISNRVVFNAIIQLWTPSYSQVIRTQIASLIPPPAPAPDNPPGVLLGTIPQGVLQAYKATEHIYVPRTVIHLPVDITQLETNPIPFTRKDIHVVGKYFYDSEKSLDRSVYYKQRRLFFVSDNPAPTFTTGYLIAFQPNAFQVLYPGPVNSYQGMNRYVAIPLVTTREFLTITLGPLMREYKQGNAITLEASIADPSENPPRPYNPEGVFLNLIKPNGSLELSSQSMQNITTGLYRHTWQSTTDKVKGIYKIDIYAISGDNTSQTIIQGSFRLV